MTTAPRRRKPTPAKRSRPAPKVKQDAEAADPYLASLRPIWSTLVKGRREFAQRGPIVVLYDIEEERLYVYPMGPFKDELSPASQASLDEQWREAEAKGQTVVFVRDNTAKSLVSTRSTWNRLSALSPGRWLPGYALRVRTLSDLIVTDDPGWNVVLDLVRSAKNRLEVLPCSRADGEATLVAMQVTSRSPLGAVALESGGMLVDQGWVRVLGAGGEKLKGSLRSWNGLGDAPFLAGLPGALVVALDALGGVFALDGGRFGSGSSSVHYFAPDSLEWENTGKGYTDLLAFLFDGDLDHFYDPYRWDGWQREVAALDGDTGIHVYPPLFTKEGKDIARQHRKAVPMRELVTFNFDMRLQVVGRPA